MNRWCALLVGLVVVFSSVPGLGAEPGSTAPVESAAVGSAPEQFALDALDGGLGVAAGAKALAGRRLPGLFDLGRTLVWGSGVSGSVLALLESLSGGRAVVTASAHLALVLRWAALFLSLPVSDVTVDIDPGVVTTLVSDLGSVRDVVVWDGLAYVVGATAIRVVDLDTGAVSVFAGSTAEANCVNSSDPEEVRFKGLTAVTTDGEWLYVTGECTHPSNNVPNAIRRVDMATGATSTVAIHSSSQFNDIVFAADGMLYATTTSTDRRVYQFDPANGSSSLFATVPLEDFNSSQSLRAITADTEALYVVHKLTVQADPDFIKRIDLDTAEITTVGSALHIGDAIESAGDFLYAAGNFSNSEPGRRVYRFAKADGALVGVAGSGSDGLVDGVEVEAWFSRIEGISSDGESLWIADGGTSLALRRMVDAPAVPRDQDPGAETTVAIDTGRVTTLAGDGTQATVDGTGTSASFDRPRGVAVVGGLAYVAQPDAIRVLDLATDEVTTFAGTPGTTGCTDSVDPQATSFLVVAPITSDGTFLYSLNNCLGFNQPLSLRRTSLATGATTTIVIVPYTARDLTFGPDGMLYLAMGGAQRIDRVDPVTGIHETNAVGDYYGTSVSVDGITSDDGGLWVVVWKAVSNQWIDRITLPDGNRTLLVTDNSVRPRIVSAGDYLYAVAGSTHRAIRRYSKEDGSFITVAGPNPPTSSGYVDGLGTKARFNNIRALASDGRRLLVADQDNHRIRAVANDGFFSYGAGSFGWDGYGAWYGGVNTGLGSYVTSATDAAVATVGPALEVTRTYNSADPGVGAFGRGWTFSYDIRWEQDDLGNIGVLFPDGRREIHLKDGSTYVPPPGYFSMLTGSPSSGFTLTTKDGTQVGLAADGRVTSLTDRNGRALSFTYSGSGELETVTAASGRSLSFTWSNGRITEVATDSVAAHSGPLVWKYYYDGDLLTAVCDPRDNSPTGVCVSYDYTLDQLSEITRPEGNREVGITYRADGRIQTRIDGLGNSTGYAYPQAGVVEVTDPRSHTTTQEHDDQFRLVRQVDPADGVTAYTYDSAGNRETITDPLGHVSTLGYDARGNVTSVTNPEDEASYFVYDGTDDLIEERDARSSGPTDNTFLTTYEYDAVGNRIAQTDPLGNKTTWTYTDGTEAAVGGGVMPPGLVKTMVTPRGNETGANPALFTTSYAYDSAGNLRTATSPSGLVTTYTYDELGRMLTETITDTIAGTQATATYTYDQVGNILTVTSAGIENPISEVTHRQRTTNSYDGNSNLTQRVVSDLTGGDASRTTVFSYDLNDREISVTDPEGGVLSRTYDPAGNVASVTDQEGRVVVTTHDSRNLPVTVTAKDFVDDPIASSTPRDVVLSVVEHDAAGRRVTETDAEGRVGQWTYDKADRILSVTLLGYRDPDETTRDIVLAAYTYDPAGNVLTETVGGGLRTITHVYDEASRLFTSSLDMGTEPDRVISSDYDADGNVTEVSLSDGSRTEQRRFTYDPENQLLTETVGNGAVDLLTTYTYDQRSNRISVTGPEANTTTYSYDEANRQTTDSGPQVDVEEDGGAPTTVQPTSVVGYNTFGDPTHLRDPRDQVTVQAYDRLGRRTQIQHPDYTDPDSTVVSPTETFTYDEVGNLISRTSRRGHVTEFTFDDLNRVVRQLDPLVTGESARGAIRFEYDDVGNRTGEVDQTGARAEWSYDALDRVRTQTQVVRNLSGPDVEHVTGFDYDDLGNQTLVEDPDGQITTHTFSPASELLSVTDSDNQVTGFQYDLAGRQTRVTDPLGRITDSVYDLAGRRIAEQRRSPSGALLAEWSFTYDGNGNLLTVTSALGHVTEYTYDALSRLIEVTVPVDTSSTITSSYGYDSAGNLTRFTDGENNTTIYRYQEWGLQAEVEEPATTQHPNLSDRLWVTVYDSGGLPLEERQPGGVTVTRSFDELGRLTQESGSGTGVVPAARSFGYDPAGRMVTASHPDGTLGFGYDDRGLLTDVTGPAGAATYTYDPVGRMIERVDAAGTATFTWTIRSELESVDDPITGTVITYDWDAASQPTTITYGTGQAPTRSLVWDDQSRLVSDTLTNPSQSVVVSFAYDYDDDNNVVSVDVDLGGNALDGLHQYDHDHAGRLVSWTDPTQTTITYTWDGASNRTAAGTDSFTYDQRNRLVASPDGTHTHSPRGTLASVGTTTYDFDALGRLVEADGVAYTFDALDRVVTRNSVAFAYNSPGRDPVSDGGHMWSRSPGGRLIAQDDGTNQRLAGLNRHGDLAYLFTTAGQLSDTVVYDPFGVPAAATGSGGSTLGFQGDYTDPDIDQVWMGARWYQPAHAVFTSRDTVFGELTTPVSLNRYTYAVANPLAYWDPDGRQAALIDDPIGRLTTSRTTRSRDAAVGRLGGLAGRYLASQPPSTSARQETAHSAAINTQRRGVGSLSTSLVGSVLSSTSRELGSMLALAAEARAAARLSPTAALRFLADNPVVYQAVAHHLSHQTQEASGGRRCGIASALCDFGVGLAQGVKGVADTVVTVVTDPIGTASGILDTAVSAYQQGSNPITGVLNVGNELLVQPLVSMASECIPGLGSFEGCGETLGTVATVWAGGHVASVAVRGVRSIRANRTSGGQSTTTAAPAPQASPGANLVRYDPDFAISQLTRNFDATASQLAHFGRAQGWKPVQSAAGPLRFVDENGIVRLTIKQGSPRAPGSGVPHVGIRSAAGQRVDAFGNPVTRRSPGNHTPIIWDLP